MGNKRKSNGINILKTKLQEEEVNNIFFNIFFLKKWLNSKDFEALLQSFGEEKNESMDSISKLISANKVKLVDLEKLSVNLNNILDYDERDFLDTNLQNIIAQIFLKKLYELWQKSPNFKENFELMFGEVEKIKNKKLSFRVITTRRDDLFRCFPDLLKWIQISNKDIFDDLEKAWHSINKINSFWDQDLSTQHIISELLYRQNKTSISKIETLQKNIENQAKNLANPVHKLSLGSVSDRIVDLGGKKDKEELSNEERESINKQIWQEYLKNMETEENNKNIIAILQKLVNNNFNFWELTSGEQTIFVQKHIEKALSSTNVFLDSWDIDKKTYDRFLKEISDFEKKEHELRIPFSDWNEIILDIKKWFRWWEHLQFLDLENFKETKSLPIFFDISLEKNEPEIIQLLEDKENAILSSSKNYDGLFSSYYTKNWEVRLGNNYKIKLEWVELTVDELDSMFDENKEDLEKSLKRFGLWEQTSNVFQKVISSKKTLDDFANNSQNTSIFEGMLKELNLDILSKDLKFDLNNVNKLPHLYLFWNANKENIDAYKKEYSTPKDERKNSSILSLNEKHGAEKAEEYAKEIFEELENSAYSENPYYIFDDAKSKYDSLNSDWKKKFEEVLEQLSQDSKDTQIQDLTTELFDYLHGTEEEEEVQREKVETEEERFMKERESLSWYDFNWEKDKGFRPGTRLFINTRGSKLPPMDKEDTFFEFEIVSVGDSSFDVKVMWNEIDSDAIGQIFTLPKTAEHLSKMKWSGEIFKVDKLSWNDWNSSMNNIIKSSFFKKFNVFGEQEWQIKLKDWKLINDKWEEIQSFGRSVDIWDWNKKGRPWQSKEHTTYEIKKIDKSKWTVKVSCNFDWQDEDDLSKWVNYKYEKELSFEKFILLMESKSLRGYTKEEHKDRMTKYNVNYDGSNKVGYPQKGLLKFYSLAAIGNAFKNGFKAIKEWTKKIEEEQTEDFENFLYSKWWLDLYAKLWSITSMFGLFPTVSEAFDRTQLDFYNERENKTWKKIEIRYKKFESDPHFASMRWDQLDKLLTTPGYIWWDRNRHKVAAAFLILMKKDWPYGRGGLLKYMWKWFWIEKFLGKEHLVRFQNMQKERQRQLEEYHDNNPHRRKTRQEELNRLEFDYIVWVIDGREPFLSLKDEFLWAGTWSRKFATTLDEHSKAYFSSFKKRSDEIWDISFRQAEQEYFRMITAGRIHKALPFLKRIMEDAQTKQEESRAKMYFLWAMLTGIIKNWQDVSVMTEFWTIARTMWLLPGIWCRDTDQADKVQILLDGITSVPPFEKFSTSTKYKKSDFEPWTFNSEQSNMKFLSKDFPNYRKKYGDKILDVLEFREMNSENSIINLAEKWDKNAHIYKSIINLSREETQEDINQKVSYTYWYYAHSPLTANKWVVEKLVPRNWDYKWKETIEIESAQEFWKSVWSTISTSRQSSKWVVEFYLWKFWNRFDIDVWDQWNVSFMMRWLSLVKQLKSKGKDKEAKYLLRYLIKWNIHEKLWAFPSEFGTVVDKFVEFFDNNVDMIDSKMVKNTFGDEAAIGFDDPYWMLNWNEFSNIIMATDWYWGTKEKNEYQRKHNRAQENQINRHIDRISRSLKRKTIFGQPIVPDSDEEVEYGSDL